MSELPGLDTDDIGLIMYENIGTIDPLDAADAFDVYEEYSNGIEGVFTFTSQDLELNDFGYIELTLPARVKDDGWISVWLEAPIEYAANVDLRENELPVSQAHMGGFRNTYDDTNSRSEGLYSSYANPPVMPGPLNDILAEYDESVSFEDCNFYDFNYPDATNMTMVGAEGSDEYYIEPTEETNLHGWVTWGNGGNDDGFSDQGSATLTDIDGNNLTVAEDRYHIGSVEMLEDDRVAAGQEVTFEPTGGGPAQVSNKIYWD